MGVADTDHVVKNHKVVSQQEWLKARRALLEKEKALTHHMEEVSAARRALPWVQVDKDYRFDSSKGQQTLSDLFDGRSQLIVYHFMFGPGWPEGCPGCSFVSDHFDGANQHLRHHDVSLVAVSRAPLSELQPFKQRMGWKFHWVSSAGSDFNYDYGVSFTEESIARGQMEYNYRPRRSTSGTEEPGASVFYKDGDGNIFHTWSGYARGLDILLGAHNFLDLTPKGRNERETMDWVRHHDKYESAQATEHRCCSGDKAS
jgi:predicted dithiol-disulfide oxidoreductase (DUF899 family)